jgi:hypothetical protein
MAGRFCQECGAPNEANALYCAKCGSVLRAGVPPLPPPAAPPPYYGPPAYGPPGYAPRGYPSYPAPYPTFDYAALDRQKQIDRTKWGILLLAIGALLLWIPLVNAVAGFISLIGVILGILGRKAFGDRHAKFVVISVVLYILVVIPPAFYALSFGFAAGFTGDVRGVASQLWPLLISSVFAGIGANVSWLLFAHELEAKPGRMLLYAAVAAGAIVLPVVLFVGLAPTVNALVAEAQGGTMTLDAFLDRFSAIETLFDLATAPSSVLFAIAYLLAWQRINRGEIPAYPRAPAQPASPSFAPPTASPPAPSPPPAPPNPPLP